MPLVEPSVVGPATFGLFLTAANSVPRRQLPSLAPTPAPRFSVVGLAEAQANVVFGAAPWQRMVAEGAGLGTPRVGVMSAAPVEDCPRCA